MPISAQQKRFLKQYELRRELARERVNSANIQTSLDSIQAIEDKRYYREQVAYHHRQYNDPTHPQHQTYRELIKPWEPAAYGLWSTFQYAVENFQHKTGNLTQAAGFRYEAHPIDVASLVSGGGAAATVGRNITKQGFKKGIQNQSSKSVMKWQAGKQAGAQAVRQIPEPYIRKRADQIQQVLQANSFLNDRLNLKNQKLPINRDQEDAARNEISDETIQQINEEIEEAVLDSLEFKIDEEAFLAEIEKYAEESGKDILEVIKYNLKGLIYDWRLELEKDPTFKKHIEKIQLKTKKYLSGKPDRAAVPGADSLMEHFIRAHVYNKQGKKYIRPGLLKGEGVTKKKLKDDPNLIKPLANKLIDKAAVAKGQQLIGFYKVVLQRLGQNPKLKSKKKDSASGRSRGKTTPEQRKVMRKPRKGVKNQTVEIKNSKYRKEILAGIGIKAAASATVKALLKALRTKKNKIAKQIGNILRGKK